MENPIITWTLLMSERFKEAVGNAERLGRREFRFDDHDFDVRYAKYLIEYLESVFHVGR